ASYKSQQTWPCCVPTGGPVAVPIDSFAHHDRGQRWPGKSAHGDKWKICLNAARIPRIRRAYDEANTPESRPGFQGKGGRGRDQGREDAVDRKRSSDALVQWLPWKWLFCLRQRAS